MSNFNVSTLPLESTGSFEKTIISYINGHKSLKKLYDFEPDLEGFRQRIAAGVSSGVDRPLLVSILKDQYAPLNLSKDFPAMINVEALLDSNTYCVTTGHQLNIFSGPLYVLYKLITTINLTEKLKQEFPENNFVPVYWMATEDHDIDEINHISLFSKKILYESSFHGKSGELKLDGFDVVIKSVIEILGDTGFAKEIIQFLKDAYSTSTNLAEATRKWTNSLLGKYGLVILDADVPLLKKNFAKVMEKELREQFTIPLVNKAMDLLSPEFTVQVNPREINLFYINNETRNRIVKKANSFEVLNTNLTFSEDQILLELESHPEKFSPNVLLRPIYQETILPNLAYVGGPSEITYWLELKFVFNELKLNMPILILRNCAMVADRSTIAKWSKLGFQTVDLFRPENELIRTFLESKNLAQFSLTESSEKLSAIFDKISLEISNVDHSLKATADSEKQKALNSLKLIEEKVVRAMKRKEETEVNQIIKVREKFFPGDTLQERHDTLLPFYLKWGNEFIEEIKKSFDPFDKNFVLLEEK